MIQNIFYKATDTGNNMSEDQKILIDKKHRELIDHVYHQKELLVKEVMAKFLEREPNAEDIKRFSFVINATGERKEYIAFCGVVIGEIRLNHPAWIDYLNAYRAGWEFIPQH